MKTKIFKNANYIGLIVIVLIFLFIYFSYFFIYIPDKESQLQQKGFRILKEYGSNMLDKHKYFESHFKNYGIYYAIRFSGDSINEDVIKVVKGLQSYVITKAVKNNRDSIYIQQDQANKLLLSFRKKNADTGLIDSIKNISSANKSIESILKAGFLNSVPIDKFMEGLKFDQLFENIALFDESRVYYDSNLNTLEDITNPEALCDSSKNTQGGIIKTLNIRGEEKHVMILPVDFIGKRFYIAGFISDTDYRSKTRTINNQIIILIASILLLVFIGMPVLKIIFIDPQERLKAIDASASGISILFGTGLIVLITISFLKNQYADRAVLSNRIQNISDSLYSNVTTDIDSIKNLYKAINQIQESRSSLLSRLVSDELNKEEKFRQLKGDTLKSPFLLNEIILIDSLGIVEKAVTSTPFSSLVKIDLSERQYFKNARDIKNSWPTSDGLNFYIESIKSYNTGYGETAVSFHNPKSGSFPVLAITSAIPSLYNQVLPKDIQFVIIDQSGKVLYHSIKSKNLHENFIEECESDFRLTKAIDLRVEDKIEINYSEKKWLARIIPIKDTPLYHITLLDLNQTDNKNARIFLFTFYFLIASLIFIIFGLMILHLLTSMQNDSQKNTWLLNWLFFQPRKYVLYKGLSAVLSVIIIVQLAGVLITEKPVAILLYQLIFIVYTLFVSMVFLNRNEEESQKSFQNKFFSELNILVATVLLIILFIWKFNTGSWFLIPLIVLIIGTSIIYRIFKNHKIESLIDFDEKNLNEQKLKRTYLIFLFLWVTSLTIVPVIQYYLSIRNQEELFWKQEQFFKVAQDNLRLKSDYNDYNSDWFKRIQGNGIDFLRVSYPGPEINVKFDSALFEINRTYNSADSIYTSLPDPITNGYTHPELFKGKNNIREWFINDTLFYKKGGEEGVVWVKSTNNKLFNFQVYRLLPITFIIIVLVLSIWFILKYAASVILNLNQEKLVKSDISWFDILGNNNIKRILLKSFNGECFLTESKNFSELPDKNIGKIEQIQTSQIIKTDFNAESILKTPDPVIWISGLKQCINQIDKHEQLLSFLSKLNQNSTKKIVFDLSFELDLINEFYDDYIAASELTPAEHTQIFLNRRKWNSLFESYYSYNGFLNQVNSDVSKNKEIEECFRNSWMNTNQELRFANIWNNLTGFEKILLYDLADDGLLNRKNKVMIQKLISKKLIIPDPYPVFFAEEFKNFVLQTIKPSEIKVIERKLGLKGSWHNAKYLILLILIPLASFILISQGLSIEKIFGIFAGGLTVVGGLMRLFDSSSFKQSSS